MTTQEKYVKGKLQLKFYQFLLRDTAVPPGFKDHLFHLHVTQQAPEWAEGCNQFVKTALKRTTPGADAKDYQNLV